jgi:hypothetical protein
MVLKIDLYSSEKELIAQLGPLYTRMPKDPVVSIFCTESTGDEDVFISRGKVAKLLIITIYDLFGCRVVNELKDRVGLYEMYPDSLLLVV